MRLDDMGVRGVNLLEFCFPLCNAEAFRDRGFELRKHPSTTCMTTGTAAVVPVRAARPRRGVDGICCA